MTAEQLIWPLFLLGVVSLLAVTCAIIEGICGWYYRRESARRRSMAKLRTLVNAEEERRLRKRMAEKKPLR